jgi:hypothetical protein
MLKAVCERWNQSLEKLIEAALKAEHSRTREKLMALYEICGGKNATKNEMVFCWRIKMVHVNFKRPLATEKITLQV